jgi:hypothetical protein
MSTLEQQYKNFLNKKPKSTYSFDEWLDNVWIPKVSIIKEKRRKLSISSICSQIYLIPTIKITHNKFLNGNYELCFVWLKWQFTFSFTN